MPTKQADRTDEQNRLIAKALAELAAEQKGLAAQSAEEFAATLPEVKDSE